MNRSREGSPSLCAPEEAHPKNLDVPRKKQLISPRRGHLDSATSEEEYSRRRGPHSPASHNQIHRSKATQSGPPDVHSPAIRNQIHRSKATHNSVPDCYIFNTYTGQTSEEVSAPFLKRSQT